MSGRFTIIVLTLATATNLKVTATDCDRSSNASLLKNIGYLGTGYDIAFANPLPTRLGVDPGYRQPIFDLSDYRGDRTSDARYLIPYGTQVIMSQSCSVDFVSETFNGAKSFQQSLLTSFNMKLPQIAFAGSSDYKRMALDQSESWSKKFFTESKSRCEVYNARLLSFTLPKLHVNFINAVKNLPTLGNDSDSSSKIWYMEFINSFGTHLASEINMGGVYAVRTSIKEELYRRLTYKGVDIKASLSAYGQMTVGIKKQVNETQSEALNTEIVETSTISIGSRPPSDGKAATWAQTALDEPSPVRVSLRNITDLLTNATFPNDTLIDVKRRRLQLALDEYPQKLFLEGQLIIIGDDLAPPERSAFAGVYDPEQGEYYGDFVNPLTGKMNCPIGANPYKLESKIFKAVLCLRRTDKDPEDVFGGMFPTGGINVMSGKSECVGVDMSTHYVSSYDKLLLKISHSGETFTLCIQRVDDGKRGIIRGGYTVYHDHVTFSNMVVTPNPFTLSGSCDPGYDARRVVSISSTQFTMTLCIKNFTMSF